MSRSPQNGGFHRSTGGGPLAVARASDPVIASRPDCPSFAMVCREVAVWTRVRGEIIREFVVANVYSVAQSKLCSCGRTIGSTSGFSGVAHILHRRHPDSCIWHGSDPMQEYALITRS